MISKENVIELLNGYYPHIISLMQEINSLRENQMISYSKNVFLPLTDVCRNQCGYCIFRKSPENKDARILMDPREAKDLILQADRYKCHEALFTFGEYADQFSEVRIALKKLGYESMLEYLYHLCEFTLKETSLLPHSNPGILNKTELKCLKEVNASLGLMLESSSSRLMETVAHEKSPGKDPHLRIKTIENAGKLKIPFTTGLLIGIGETIEERADSLLEIRKLQDKYGHIQEIIIQNFKPKPGIAMENFEEPSLIEMLKIVAVTKLLFPDVSVQVPPNLNQNHAQIFLLAGADDWGGVSPFTKDYVNPEAPWPELDELQKLTEELGFQLIERLPVYSNYINPEFLSDKVYQKIKTLNIN